ncbi:hypothetical protein, partial [Streptomyces flaveolus]|uniref:hypothetical protein n=1 Tax=Streptomyces flaveolus TaxID=67297 RepID=UPI003702F49A
GAVLAAVGRGLCAAGAWLGRYLVVVPAVWLYRWVLTPVGHGFLWVVGGVGAVLAAVGRGLCAAGAWLGRYLVVVPAVWLYTWVLTPLGHAIAWCLRMVVTGVGAALYWTARILLVLPALALWRWVLVPVGRGLAVVGREVGAALGHAWRIAGHVSLAVGRFLGTVFRLLVGDPARWVYRTLLTPVGHVVRDAVWRPAADASRAVGRVVRQVLADVRGSVRRARADVRRALFGEPAKKPQVARREPSAAKARTLGSSTTALTKD